MNSLKSISLAIISLLVTTAILANSSYADLNVSKSERTIVNACRYFGQQKQDKKAINPLINLLTQTKSNRVAVESSLALGYIGQRGPAVSAIKQKIMSTKNTDVVYAGLLAILNITLQTKTYDPDAKAALDYADKNYRDDEFIADMIDKIKAKINVLK